MQSNEVGIYACGGKPGDYCPNIHILNNMVAGVNGSVVDTAAYVVMGHQCGWQAN